MVNESKLDEVSQILALTTAEIRDRNDQQFRYLVTGLLLLFIGTTFNTFEWWRYSNQPGVNEVAAELLSIDSRVEALENRFFSITIIRESVGRSESQLKTLTTEVQELKKAIKDVRVDK
jgi:hypothetical protein